MKKVNYKAIALFYAIAVLLRFLAIKTNLYDYITNDCLQILARGVGPAFGALVSIKVFKIPVSISLKGNFKNTFLPFLVFWLLPVVLLASIFYIKEGRWPILLLFSVLMYGLLEEIGWRGFLQEQLNGLPKFQSILIISLLWFIWHLNFDFSINNIIFFFIILLGSWGIGRVYEVNRSLLAVAGFHSLNNFFQNGLHERELILIAILLTIWVGFMVAYKRRNKIVSLN